ncbi:unnamed protein product, partial [Symbiodinium necroappetens]
AAQAAQARAQGFAGPPGLAQAQAQARRCAGAAIADYSKMLEKALQQLNSTLPRESAEKAQALLHGYAMDKPEEVCKVRGKDPGRVPESLLLEDSLSRVGQSALSSRSKASLP